MSVNRRLFLVSGLALSACTSSPIPAPPQGRILRDYVDGPFGQIHFYHAGNPKSPKTPLVLFHPTAVSGAYYRDFMLEMSKDRYVIAFDTPGYGKSDPPAQPQGMTSLASALADATDALGLKKFDVLGYHTGCYIAAEMAILRPTLVRRLILPGIPYYSGEEQKEMYAKYGTQKPPNEDSSDAQKIWGFWVTGRNKAVPLERGIEHFTDHIQSYPRSSWAYHSVFSYDADSRLPQVTQPVLIPNTHGSLQNETRAAGALMPNVTLIEVPELQEGVFDLGVPKLAALSREFLN